MIVRSILVAALFVAPAIAQNTGLLSTVGVNSYIQVPYDPALVPQSGLTIEAWVTYDDSTIPTGLAYYPTLVRQNVAPGGESYLLRVNAGSNNTLSILFLVRDRNNVVHTVNAPFQSGQLSSPTHLAATYGPAGLAIFLNGQGVAGTPAATAPIADNGGVLRIGTGDTTYPGYESWNGEIDELRIWPFARSAAQIQASMTDELSAIPGDVLSFNLNNSTSDSSKGLTGTTVGSLVFQANGLTLTSTTGMAQTIGQSWSTCAPIGNTFSSLPRTGNSVFEVVGTHGPASGVGVLFAATAATASPIQLLGIGVYIQSVFANATLPTDAFGTARATLPVPPAPALVGASLCMQWAFADASCGAPGLTASPALCFTIQ